MAGTNRDLPREIYSEEQIRRAINAAGVRVASEIGSHFIVYCPFHDNFNTASAEIDKETGMFYCFSCKAWSDLPDVLMRTGNITWFQAVRLIGDANSDIVAELDNMFKADEAIPEFDSTVVDMLHSNVWGRGSDYFLSRFITTDSIHKFKLGYSSKQDMVIIPVYSPKGILWGFVGRSVEGKVFKNSKNLKKSKTLFNLSNVWTSDRVFVVESSFDAIRLDQVDLPAVATLGAGITREQIDLLKRTFDDIMVLPDNDDAGNGMGVKILSEIPYATIIPLEGVHDVGDLSDEDLTGL
jgi:DNA primase